ncbi:DUF6612 family protein [Gracilibacillus lacisalsi]|uniref:DUF6612 family protein n=1 Tax=Gracilibacillus lacisalsi TaxID=393087 RepID=UPI00039AF625|nr:DUF6612 family protein [Gracilibacillus lacisalsi]
MKLSNVIKWCLGILLIFLIIGCRNEELSKDDALQKMIENTKELESFSFQLDAEQIDGMDNETKLELKGETTVDPFHASMEMKQKLYDEWENMLTYYQEDMVYYNHPDLDYLVKGKITDETILLKGMEKLYENIEMLQFNKESENYLYEYDGENKDKNISILKALYPVFAKSSSVERGVAASLMFDYIDIVELNVRIKVNKQSLQLTELQIDYIGESKFVESNPPQMKETVTFVLSNHNEIENLELPADEIENALTIAEHFTTDIEEEDEEDNKDEVEQLGNTGANIMNHGKWATDGEWIYFSSLGKGINRMRRDGTDQTRLSEERAANINVVNDKLYYIQITEPADLTQGAKLIQMNKDGSDRQQIYDISATNLIVKNEWMYYLEVSDTPTPRVYLEKQKTNLSYGERILEDVGRFIIENDKIVYQKTEDNQLYYTDIDVDIYSQESETALDGKRARSFAMEDDWIYYENANHNYHLYRFNLETEKEEELTTYPVEGFNVDNHVFYRNPSDNWSLYRLDVNTMESEKLDEGSVYFLHIIDGYVYYAKIEEVDTEDWYRIPVDGKEIEKVQF